jgi:ATP-dependent DNA helicase RecQ
LSVGAKHLEDKLSVIAKNSSPNASPVQLSVVNKKVITKFRDFLF